MNPLPANWRTSLLPANWRALTCQLATSPGKAISKLARRLLLRLAGHRQQLVESTRRVRPQGSTLPKALRHRFPRRQLAKVYLPTSKPSTPPHQGHRRQLVSPLAKPYPTNRFTRQLASSLPYGFQLVSATESNLPTGEMVPPWKRPGARPRETLSAIAHRTRPPSRSPALPGTLMGRCV